MLSKGQNYDSDQNESNSSSSFGVFIEYSDSDWISDAISFTTMSLSFIIDITCLKTVFLSRLRLIPTEFYILLLNSLLILLIKATTAIYNFTTLVLKMKPNLMEACLSKYIIDLELFFSYYVVLFYYSIFHMSILKRNSLVIALFDMVHSTICFFIFLGLLSTSYGIFVTAFSYINREIMFLTQDRQKCFEEFGVEVIIPAMFLHISYVTMLVYIVAVIVLIGSRSKSSMLTMSEVKKQRKNIIVLVKFSFFSFFTCILALAQNIPILLLFLLSPKNANYYLIIRICGFIYDILVFIHPIFLILIHNILRRRFLEMIQFMRQGFNLKLNETSMKKSHEC